MKRQSLIIVYTLAAGMLSSCVTQKQLAAVKQEATPVGTIASFGGLKVPAGWLSCDGRLISKMDYPELFNAIGTNWGGTANDEFKIPDLRGYFLRGIDSTKTVDPQANTRTDINGNRVSDVRVGTYQQDATRMPRAPFITGDESNTHTHGYADAHYAENNCGNVAVKNLQGNRGPTDADNGRCITDQTTVPNSQSHTHPITGGDIESRPKNAYVRFIIKYK
jgi:hypothetical protein